MSDPLVKKDIADVQQASVIASGAMPVLSDPPDTKGLEGAGNILAEIN